MVPKTQDGSIRVPDRRIFFGWVRRPHEHRIGRHRAPCLIVDTRVNQVPAVHIGTGSPSPDREPPASWRAPISCARRSHRRQARMRLVRLGRIAYIQSGKLLLIVFVTTRNGFRAGASSDQKPDAKLGCRQGTMVRVPRSARRPRRVPAGPIPSHFSRPSRRGVSASHACPAPICSCSPRTAGAHAGAWMRRQAMCRNAGQPCTRRLLLLTRRDQP